MLAWVVAAACMWRGLTSDEADAVQVEVQARINARAADPLIDPEVDLTAGEARDILDAAIATVLEQTRP